MREVRILSASGQIGSGFLESSFARGLSLKPHVIACDGGSTDAGPYYLGSGKPHFSREGTRRDLRLMIRGGLQLGVPVIVGSCGFGGGDDGLAWMRDLAVDIAKQDGLAFKMALIHAEQDKSVLKQVLREGRIEPLKPAPALDETVIDRSAHIVAMMGHEPIAEAISQGAQLILCGRSSDTALFAAVPLMQGAHAGSAWHAAKILECGTACVVQRKRPDCLFAWVRDDHFDIEPLDLDAACTPQSVASHTLYENADPFHITEPGGVIDSTASRYQALDDRSVRVTHSRFQASGQFTAKLEGAVLDGYQAVAVGGVRDPFIIEQLDDWLEGMLAKFSERVTEMFDGRLSADDYHIGVRVYGRDGVMGPLEPLADQVGHEVGLVFTLVGPDAETTDAIAKTFTHFAVHFPIRQWHGLITGIAFPLAPAHVNAGPIYRFNLNHVVKMNSPVELFRTEYVEV